MGCVVAHHSGVYVNPPGLRVAVPGSLCGFLVVVFCFGAVASPQPLTNRVGRPVQNRNREGSGLEED